MLAPGERPGDEHEALVGEPVHEGGVVGHIRLRGDPPSSHPGPASRMTA